MTDTASSPRNARAGRPQRDPRLVNLALQGGGSHAAFAWGVLDRLLEDGRLEFEAISGASAGAMNAVVLADGWLRGGRDAAREALDRFWQAVGRSGSVFGPALPVTGVFGTPVTDDWISRGSAWMAAWYDMASRLASPYQWNPANINPLRDVLAGQIDFERLRAASPIRLFVSATSVRSGQARVFGTHQLSLEVLLASACVPTVFQTVEIDGEAYWDGGYLADPAIFPFFYECRSRDVLVVMINPLERADAPRHPDEILDRLHEISFNASLIAEMRAIAFVQKLVREDWLVPERRDRLKDVLVHLVRADEALSALGAASKFVTAPAFLAELRERGRQAADRWLSEALRHVGQRSSIDVRRVFLGQ